MTGPAIETTPLQKMSRAWFLSLVSLCAGLVVSGLAMLSLSLRTGDVLYEPGNTFPTEASVQVKDAGPLVDDGDGAGAETMFVTVKRREATLYDSVIRRRLDPTLVFEPREKVYGNATKEEVDKINSQQMVDSKLVAQVAALRSLGIDVEPSGSGALVLEVLKDFPAAESLSAGDTITAIGSEEVSTLTDLRDLLGSQKVGDVVDLTLKDSKGKVRSASVTLAADPDDETHAILGITTETKDLSFDLPVTIDMDSGDVTGPSAGLAWTLAVVDHLTEGDLNEGVQVAATGEIGPDGAVYPIGGLPQKSVAVYRSGIEHFLIPADSEDAEIAEAKRLTDGKVTFHKVSSVKEAMSVLDALTEK